MTTVAAWRWCLAAGVLTMLISGAFGRIAGLVACGETGGLGPVIAFEVATTPAEVAALFGEDPCRAALIPAQRTALWLDALAFIPAYAAFLSLATWAAKPRYAWPVIAALLIAALCDEVEGALLFAVLRDLPGTPPVLGVLFWAVRAKFLLLGLATLASAALLLLRWRTARVLCGLIAGVGAVEALNGFFAPPAPGMMTGFTLAWFGLLAAAAIGACWPRLLGPPPGAPARPNA